MREAMSQNSTWKASKEQHVTLTSGFTYNYMQTYTNYTSFCTQTYRSTYLHQQISKQLRTWRHFSEEGKKHKWPKSKCKCKSNPQWDVPSHPLRIAMKILKIINAGPYMEKLEILYVMMRMLRQYIHFGTECSSSWKTTELRYKQQSYHRHQYSKELKTKLQQILFLFFCF